MVSQSTSLNDLPDDILTHILSFLPIKEAFRTSILSKRWGPFCYSLPVLHFQSDNIQTNDWIPLRRLIDKVMFSPLAHHVTLKSFHLNCRYIHFHDATAECLPFHDWIEEAKRRFLKELRLSFITHIPLKPTTFFCSKTLIVLKLMDIVISTMLHCSVDLPLLKTLDLSFVTFQDMEDVMKLISGCPILEKLRTLDVKATSGVTLGGYYKPLSKLIKANIHLFEVPLRAVYNVKFLTIWKVDGEMSFKSRNQFILQRLSRV
ncbi:hypothetical protein TSUD_216880 [Trifolium subterraneum]|uniref:F-box domain-containing protein n=1 Tax=Trifolium subterraneum TaxID=3900 RepID=A0A2Z6MP95_TRISU|nr:hypothetical protein TSUD_216880 [Trifolium subterraneum]